MSHLFYFIQFAILVIPASTLCQKKWDGGGGNNQWSNAQNWTGNTLPLSTDDVVLDNSGTGVSYIVQLPSTAVTVKSITITPNSGRTIELILPATNIAVPGLTVNGPGYGLTMNSGGTFRNSSGSTSGNAVRVIDSIRINNEGRYVHSSASSHTSNVQVISTAAGTERGILELDIPTASSTISFSGRTFGKFVLRSTAAGGTCNYTAAGTSKVKIRDALEIGAGVTFNLNCSDTIFVGGDFSQESGTFNLGNSTRSVVLSLQQNIAQSVGAIITETGSGTQTILINGTGLQLMTLRGTIQNQVAVVKDAIGAVLSKAPVSLPYRLSLRNGKIVTLQGLLTLQSACTLSADTLANSFIEGPLKKDGLVNQPFLFPVGKSGTMRWVQLQNATGNFTVEYFRTDPHTLSSSNGSGIVHFSKVEYWDVTTSAGATSNIKVSFVLPGSGMVTNLASLRVARLINGTWEDAGNAGVAGTPGSDGWVSSVAASGFSAGSKSFALASASGQENPLPISSLKLNVSRRHNDMHFTWSIVSDKKIETLQLQQSYDGSHFSNVRSVNAQHRSGSFVFPGSESKLTYFRLITTDEDFNERVKSNVVMLSGKNTNSFTLLGSNIVSDNLKMQINIEKAKQVTFYIFDSKGRILKIHRSFTPDGSGIINVNIADLKSGCYYIRLINAPDFEPFKFIRL